MRTEKLINQRVLLWNKTNFSCLIYKEEYGSHKKNYSLDLGVKGFKYLPSYHLTSCYFKQYTDTLTDRHNYFSC